MRRSKERDRESEKVKQPDKLEVICPLIFTLTHLAVNYDLTWQPETRLSVEDADIDYAVTGVWKSNPVQRGHTDQFLEALKKMRESGEISWTETAYYFTHQEGIEARKRYEEMVQEGKLKAHITSWGPNPSKANDKSRFHKFTGVTFEQLKKRFPELYERKTAAAVPQQRANEKEEVREDEKSFEDIITPPTNSDRDTVLEPTSEELAALEEEAKVAAAAAPEATIEDLILEGDEDNEDNDDHTVIVLTVSESEIAERIDASHEAIGWRSESGEEMTAYLHMLPELDTEMWLPEGKWDINGIKYEVRVDR